MLYVSDFGGARLCGSAFSEGSIPAKTGTSSAREAEQRLRGVRVRGKEIAGSAYYVLTLKSDVFACWMRKYFWTLRMACLLWVALSW